MKIILIETILVCFVTLFSGYYCIDFWKALQNESNARMEKFIKSWGYTVFVAIAGFVVVTMVSIIATMESGDIYLYGVCILLANIFVLAFALGDDPNVMPSPLAIATTKYRLADG